MSDSFECRVLSGTGVCDGPISHPEEFYRQWCVIVCDLETSRMRLPLPELGCCVRGGGGERNTFFIDKVSFQFNDLHLPCLCCCTCIEIILTK
jgi:hypothetical protein